MIPLTLKRDKAISLFCGAGGADLAAHDLDLDVVACFDGGRDQVATARAAGFPAHEVWLPAVGPLPRVVWDALEQQPGLIFGGPPCQPFSSAGKGEGSDDSRDGYPAALHIVRWAMPRRGVFENVRGLLFDKHTEYRESILSELRAMGYHAGIWLLDAADQGVPQRRRRTFIWFSLDRDLGEGPGGDYSAERLVEAKWLTGDYWREHGLEQDATPMATWEERLLEQVRRDLSQQSMFSRPSWFGTKRWRTVRDALDLRCEARIPPGGDHAGGEGVDFTDRPAPSVTAQLAKQSHPWKSAGLPYITTGQSSTRTPGTNRVLIESRQGIDGPGPAVRASGPLVVGVGALDERHEAPGCVVTAIAWRRGREGGAQWEERGVDEPSVTLRGSQGGSSQPFLVEREDPSRGWEPARGGSPDQPGPAMRTRPGCGAAITVIGGGHNPNHAQDAHKRTLRPIIDEPCTTIAAQTGGGAGNAGPFVEGPRLDYIDVERGAGMCERHGDRRKPSIDEPAPTVRARSGGAAPMALCVGDQAEASPKHPDTSVDEPCNTVRSGGSGHAAPGMWMKGSRKATEPERLDATVAGGCGQWSADQETRESLEAVSGRRRLTTTESATLQDFPPEHPFQGTKTSQYTQIGNAWPRALARRVLRAVTG